MCVPYINMIKNWFVTNRIISYSTFSKKRILPDGPDLSHFINTADINSTCSTIPTEKTRMPSWIKTVVPTGENFYRLNDTLKSLNLHTVCEEAKCPNIGECWGGNEENVATATIMVNTVYNINDFNTLIVNGR